MVSNRVREDRQIEEGCKVLLCCVHYMNMLSVGLKKEVADLKLIAFRLFVSRP